MAGFLRGIAARGGRNMPEATETPPAQWPKEIPHVAIALALDFKAEKERVIIARKDWLVRSLCRTYGDKRKAPPLESVYADEVRPLFTLLNECFTDDNIYWNRYRHLIRKGLTDENRQLLRELEQSGNLAFLYMAHRLREEMVRQSLPHIQPDDWGRWDMDRSEQLLYPLRTNYEQTMEYWFALDGPAKEGKYDPTRFTLTDDLFVMPQLLYSRARGFAEYAVSDFSLTPLLAYYIHCSAERGKAIKRCKQCGRFFLGNRKETLCGQACRTAQSKANRQSYDRARGAEPVTKAYNAAYSYWNNRRQRLKKAGQDCAAFDTAMKAFQTQAKEKRRLALYGKLTMAELNSWLLGQEAIADELFEQYGRR